MFQSFPVFLEYFMILFRDTPAYPIMYEGAILATQKVFIMLKVCLYRFSECLPVWLMDSVRYYIEYCPLPGVSFNVELSFMTIVCSLYLLGHRNTRNTSHIFQCRPTIYRVSTLTSFMRFVIVLKVCYSRNVMLIR